jgi:hypothetical protein
MNHQPNYTQWSGQAKANALIPQAIFQWPKLEEQVLKQARCEACWPGKLTSEITRRNMCSFILTVSY